MKVTFSWLVIVDFKFGLAKPGKVSPQRESAFEQSLRGWRTSNR
jgi:hypothetical protein